MPSLDHKSAERGLVCPAPVPAPPVLAVAAGEPGLVPKSADPVDAAGKPGLDHGSDKQGLLVVPEGAIGKPGPVHESADPEDAAGKPGPDHESALVPPALVDGAGKPGLVLESADPEDTVGESNLNPESSDPADAAVEPGPDHESPYPKGAVIPGCGGAQSGGGQPDRQHSSCPCFFYTPPGARFSTASTKVLCTCRAALETFLKTALSRMSFCLAW